MGADQFLLTWNNHRSNFAEVFSQLRVQEQLVDVTLLCDGGSFPAHRLVLAACSPYFHQLFSRLQTQHVLVFLRDVRQTELEALLEFIYRGEVSVANSELTGLIKIAESLRIKGLGDVSQRDAAPNSRPEKRSASSYSPSRSSPVNSGRCYKAPRLSCFGSNDETKKPSESDYSSFMATPNFPLLNQKRVCDSQPFSHLMNMTSLSNSLDGGISGQDSCSPPCNDSKLRSCLEGQEPTPSNPFSHLLVQPSASRLIGGRIKKEGTPHIHKKKNTKIKSSLQNSPSQAHIEDDEKNTSSEIKRETPSVDESPISPLQPDQEAMHMLPHLQKLYEAGEFGNAFLSKYSQLINSLQHQPFQQHQQQPPQKNAQPDDDMPGSGSTPIIPPNAQEHQISPSPRDSKSLTCHLCGATIKHIANFRRHMKQHLNPRRFPCPWCSAAFGRKDNLKTHTRKHHPMEVETHEQAGPANVQPIDGATEDECQLDQEEELNKHDTEEDCDDDTRLLNGTVESRSPSRNEEEVAGEDSLVIADCENNDGDLEDEDFENEGDDDDAESTEDQTN